MAAATDGGDPAHIRSTMLSGQVDSYDRTVEGQGEAVSCPRRV